MRYYADGVQTFLPQQVPVDMEKEERHLSQLQSTH